MTTEGQPPATLVDRLSPREREIAEGVWSEASDKLICAGLHVSHSTLRTHLARIFFKLKVRSRAGVSRQVERHRVIKNTDVQKADYKAPRRRRRLRHK